VSEIFLGKPIHWLALIVACGILALVGLNYLHTSAFNLFAAITFGSGLALVLVIVLPHRPGERVTRDPIEIPEQDNPNLGPSSD